MNAIEQWIDNPTNYEQGCTLYSKYGRNSYLKQFFIDNPGSDSKELLIEELTKLAGTLPAEKVKGHFEPPLTHKQKDLPDQVKALIKEKSPVYAEYIRLKSLLIEYNSTGEFGHGNEIKVKWKVFKNEKEAGEATFQLEKCAKKLRAIWDKLDYYDLHNKLPEEIEYQKKEYTTPKEIFKRIATLRTYISRDPLSPKFSAWQQEMETLEEKGNATN